MGALHDGHLELVRQAQKFSDTVIVSIFVNPTQFGPNEDYSRYPRTWDDDLAKLQALGVAAVYAPSVADIYPNGPEITVQADPLLSAQLEGANRPGHFDGVTTVVSTLFDHIKPQAAFFGEKDYQQLCVIRKMTADLNLPIDIVGVPTRRDENGLALSSRNIYLSKEQYQIAVTLNKTLSAAADNFKQGGSIKDVEKIAQDELNKAGFDAVDYCAIRHAQTLQETNNPDDPHRILATVRLGKTRLLDNMAV